MQLLRLYHGADWPSSPGRRHPDTLCSLPDAPARTGSVRQQDLHEPDRSANVVLQRIRAYVSDWFDPEKVKLPEQDDPVRQRNQAMREELRKLRGDVERRRKAMQELYLDKVSGLIDSAQFFEMNKSFLDEVSSAEARIEKLESELEQQKEESATIQTQMQRVRELAQVSHLTRELAVLLVDRVVVGPKDARTGEQKITIEWNF